MTAYRQFELGLACLRYVYLSINTTTRPYGHSRVTKALVSFPLAPTEMKEECTKCLCNPPEYAAPVWNLYRLVLKGQTEKVQRPPANQNFYWWRLMKFIHQDLDYGKLVLSSHQRSKPSHTSLCPFSRGNNKSGWAFQSLNEMNQLDLQFNYGMVSFDLITILWCNSQKIIILLYSTEKSVTCALTTALQHTIFNWKICDMCSNYCTTTHKTLLKFLPHQSRVCASRCI